MFFFKSNIHNMNGIFLGYSFYCLIEPILLTEDLLDLVINVNIEIDYKLNKYYNCFFIKDKCKQTNQELMHETETTISKYLFKF